LKETIENGKIASACKRESGPLQDRRSAESFHRAFALKEVYILREEASIERKQAVPSSMIHSWHSTTEAQHSPVKVGNMQVQHITLNASRAA